MTKKEQKELSRIINRRNEKAQTVKRAYVMLAALENGEGICDSEIARCYKVTVRSIEGIRKRFVEEGFFQVVYGKKRTVFKEKLFDGRV